MPRRGRGGRREGKPGVAHGQRTDLNGHKPPPRAEFTGQAYGVATQQEQAQRAIPVAPPPTAGVASPPQRAFPKGPEPGTLGGLLDETARPDEPLTAGLPFGPGPGPNPFRMPDPEARAIDRLRTLYRQTGIASLGRLLESWEDDQ